MSYAVAGMSSASTQYHFNGNDLSALPQRAEDSDETNEIVSELDRRVNKPAKTGRVYPEEPEVEKRIIKYKYKKGKKEPKGKKGTK